MAEGTEQGNRRPIRRRYAYSGVRGEHEDTYLEKAALMHRHDLEDAGEIGTAVMDMEASTNREPCKSLVSGYVAWLWTGCPGQPGRPGFSLSCCCGCSSMDDDTRFVQVLTAHIEILAAFASTSYPCHPALDARA